MPLNVLILGGSSEASALAGMLAGDTRFAAVLSLAGRTARPAPSRLTTRTGGFGGAEGLADYLHAHEVDALVVATHPFAAQMRINAAAAVRRRPTRLLVIDRPVWTPQASDRWTVAPDMAAAAEALGPTPRRVLLTVGRQELQPFIDAPHHAYLVRSIDPPDRLPANAALILARGPFSEAEERQLMLDHKVQVLVTKNAGGAATEAKLLAARTLGLEVVVVARRPLPDLENLDASVAPDAPATLTWLEHQASSTTERGV